jgi:hypothetical protein
LEAKRKEKLINSENKNIYIHNNFIEKIKRVEDMKSNSDGFKSLGDIMDKIDKMDYKVTIGNGNENTLDKETLNKNEWDAIKADNNPNNNNTSNNNNPNNNFEIDVINYVDLDHNNYSNANETMSETVRNFSEEIDYIDQDQDPYEIEKEVERVNKEYADIDYSTLIFSQNLDSDDFIRQKYQYIKRKRERPYDYNS